MKGRNGMFTFEEFKEKVEERLPLYGKSYEVLIKPYMQTDDYLELLKEEYKGHCQRYAKGRYVTENFFDHCVAATAYNVAMCA